MNELPSKIMAWGQFGDDSVTGQWSSNTYHNDNVVEYVRADLVAELVDALYGFKQSITKAALDSEEGHEIVETCFSANCGESLTKLMAPT